jgi:hypothetical protein
MTQALPYIQRELADSAATPTDGDDANLASCLLDLSLEGGRISAFVASTNLKNANQYQRDASVRVARANSDFVQHVYEYLNAPNRYAVNQTYLLSAGGAWTQNRGEPFFTFRSNVFFFSSLQYRENKEDLLAVLDIDQISILSSLPEGAPAIRRGNELELDIVRTLVERTTQLIVSAFDDTGFLLWEKPEH